MTPKEMTLTQQDLAFKQAVLTDVEANIRAILPALVTACVNDELGAWIDEVVATVNAQDAAIASLIRVVAPAIEGATDEPDPTDTDD